MVWSRIHLEFGGVIGSTLAGRTGFRLVKLTMAEVRWRPSLFRFVPGG
jgi:hypothetical protein